MKADFIFYDDNFLNRLINYRSGEKKLGEEMDRISSFDELAKSSSKFVLIGIPEDIGVRANGGNGGAYSTWNPFLKSFLNVQSNPFIKPKEITVLGSIDFSKLLEQAAGKAIEEFKIITEEVDRQVEEIVLKVFNSGKVPILIGGGHNNAYPLLKSASKYFNKKISALNLDAHADLRECDGRHSGNGFSYAKKEGYLDKYYMLGLHESYNNSFIVNTILKNPDYKSVYFDNLKIKNNLGIQEGLLEAQHFIGHQLCGIELDLDSLKNVSSSAQSPSGFSVEEARKFAHFSGEKMNAVYFHICEGIYQKENGKVDAHLPKLISYLVLDFIKAFQNK